MKALALAVPAAALLVFVACSSSDSSSPGPSPDGGPDAPSIDAAPACANPGGKVSGAADTHCGTKVVTVDPNACANVDASAGDDAGGDADAGDNGPYGDTMYNDEGDDDDCKYHVKWSATPICENNDVYFTVTATYKAGGAPLKGAPIYLESRLGATHPSPSIPTSQEISDGVYKVGPVKFDLAGQWLVRFHFFQNFCDTEDSPHGHAAFFVQVP